MEETEKNFEFKKIDGISKDIREKVSESMPSRGNGNIEMNPKQIEEMRRRVLGELNKRKTAKEKPLGRN